MRKMRSSGNTACSVCVQLLRAGQVAAERLLDHDPAALVEPDRGQRVGDLGNIVGGIAM